MNRTRFYHVWICLLCLFSTHANAQTLSQYEYWFDDGFDNRVIMQLSGKERDVTASLDTRSLGGGLHQFFLRLKQSDGMYSPITSKFFLKAQVADGGFLEYWFDDDFDSKTTTSLKGRDDEDGIHLSIDASQLGNGLHQFFYRLMQAEGVYSPVSVSYFFKTEVPNGGQLEYWFDDNKTQSKKVSAHLASDGKDYIVNTALDLTTLSAGYHRLYYRFVNNNGTVCSATSMTPLMAGKPYFSTPANAKMTRYSLSVDGQASTMYDIKQPAYDVETTHSLDASALTEGTHRLDLTFWNSEGASTRDYATFRVGNTQKLSTPRKETFTATNITGTGFVASWDEVKGARYYDILVKEEGGDYANPDFKRSIPANSVEVSGLFPNTSYLFQVKARNDNRSEDSDWSPSIPKAVKTTNDTNAKLAIHSIKGFDGSEPLTVGHTYHYNVWVVNNSSSTWTGSFYLKDGDEDINGWYKQSIPSGWALPLEYDYTPESTGSKALVLYYQTGGKGHGIPIPTKEGNGDNIMMVQVNETAANPTYDLKLLEAIVCPSTVDWGKSTNIIATVLNASKESWTGTLVLTDNGHFIASSSTTIPAGKTKTVTATSWTPSVEESHTIAVSCKTNDVTEWDLVAANGFTNPIVVKVTNIDVPTTATEAILTLITKECAPAEINYGDEAFYHYRITNKKGQPLKGMRAVFSCSGSSKKTKVETEPSDAAGYTVLCLSTEGSNAFASRGETGRFVCTGLIDGNNNEVKLLKDDSDAEAFTLKIHPWSVFENLESFAFTVKLGVSGNAKAPGGLVSGDASLSFPFTIKFKWKDNGDVLTEIGGTAQVSGNVDGNIKNVVSAGVGGVVGLKSNTTYNWNIPKRTSLGMAMSLMGMKTIFTSRIAQKSIAIIEDWFADKYNPEEWFKPVIESENSCSFWGVSGKLSGTRGYNSDNPMGGTLFPELEVPRKLKTYKFGGEASYTTEVHKTEHDIKKSKDLYGFSKSLKAKINGDVKDMFSEISPAHPTLLNPIPYSSTMTASGIFMRSYPNKIDVNANFTMTSQEEEMFTSDDYKKLEKVSNSLKINAGFKLSASTLANYICEGWMSENTKKDDAWSKLYLAVGMGYKWSMSSQGAWAAYLQELANRPSTRKTASDIYPAFSNQYIITTPYHYVSRLLGDTNNVDLLNALKEATKVSGNYPIKDALKIEQQESETAELGLSIPIAKWKLFGVGIEATFDVGFTLDFTYYPSVTYYGVEDQRFFPVSLRKPSLVTTMAKNATAYIKDKIDAAFDDDDKKEICEHGRKWNRTVNHDIQNNVVEQISNAGVPHSTNTPSAKRRAPKLAAIQQNDICTFTFTVNDGTPNFDNGTSIQSSHYYPLGKLLGITEWSDTLFVVSEVFDLSAIQGTDTLKTTRQGKMRLDTYVGADDLTPFGLSEDTPLDVYQADEGSDIWHYVGPAGGTMEVDKLGSYMMATSIRNDMVAPVIAADMNSETGVLHLYVSDNIALKTSTLTVYINGQARTVTMINESNFEVQLSQEELKYMLNLYATVYDLAGNQGTLLQVYNIDKPEVPSSIEETKAEKEDNTQIRLSKNVLKVEGAQPNVHVRLFSTSGTILAQGVTDTHGTALIHLNQLPTGTYIVALSTGKSKKYLIK